MSIRDGERPSSDFTPMEIAFARAEGWFRVEDDGLGYVSPVGVRVILKARKNVGGTS